MKRIMLASTPLAMTNTSAALTWQAEHYPFGGIYSLAGSATNDLRRDKDCGKQD